MQLSKLQVKIINDLITQDLLPKYATNGSAGMDLRACLTDEIALAPDESRLIPTGIAIYIADTSLCGLIIPRSGLGHKNGIILGNSVGLIDSDYQGELMVSLWNRSPNAFTIKPLDRIAQLVLAPIVQVELQIVDTFDLASIRSDAGFGSTGFA